MKTLKKALSVMLCAVMMFTTLCFFTVGNPLAEVNAAVVNTGSRTAFYAPEVIYLYPEVTSWAQATSTPFQYYVGNTVNTADIYSAPAVNSDTATEGKLYFAAEEGMSDVKLSTRYLDLQGSYMSEDNKGTVEYTIENKGTYYLVTVTGGTSPELAADVNGCYIEWCLTYTTDKGEVKAVFTYSYIYKPYVVPYGAAARVYNDKGDVDVYGQHITWVTGVHSADNTASQTNNLYPWYMPVSQVTVSSDNKTDGKYSFSPFLSKNNKAYAGGVEVTGAAPVANGTYNAVFAGTDANTAYFWANQTGADFTRSYRVKEFFYTTAINTPNVYPVAFDYMNNGTATSQYALSQVTPSRLGTITVDSSRYSNLNEIPNLAVGMMATDTDVEDAVTSNTPYADAQWYIGDATGMSHDATGAYTSQAYINSAKKAVYVKFASEEGLTAPLDEGIWYAGAWDKAIDKNTSSKTYTVKSYYEAKDREGDVQAASAAVGLNVKLVDKTELRAAVNNAASYLGALGVKSNWNSYYYDVNYVDPDTSSAAWARFETAYKNACGALVNVDKTFDYEAFITELESSLAALLSGKGLRVYFDVNHDDIGVNLWINPSSTYYDWNAENETAVINGNFSADVQYGTTAFTPDADTYIFTVTQVSGSFNGAGCVVFDTVDENRSNVTNSANKRYNFDFEGSATKTITYNEADFVKVDGLKFWSWYYNVEGSGVYDNLALQIKIEKGSEQTAYSPVGKVVGTTYGTLPSPERDGYTFAGWYADEALTTAVNSESAVSSRILYAKWTANEYSVSYDNLFSVNEMATFSGSMHMNKDNASVSCENGVITITADGTSNGDVYATEGKSGNHYTIPVEPSKEYVFEYDLDVSEGGGSQVILFFYDDNENSSTLYTASDVTYTYYKPDGDVYTAAITSSPHSACYVHSDGHVVIRFTPHADARLLSIRFGSANSTNTVTKFSNIRLIDAETYDSNINWTAAQKSVAFDADGYGTLAEATREGYVFDGWYTAGGEKITEDTPVKSENISVYSSWIPNQYSVALDGNTGIGGIGMFNAVYGTPFNLPANYFIKTGYTFAGWSTSPDGEVLYTDKEEVSDLTSEVNGSVTLYAVWTANEFTVKFDGNKGTGEMADVTVVYDSGASLPACEFTRTGYTFIGWSLTADGGELITEAAYDNLKTEQGDEVTLYAIWSENSYTLAFDKNGGEGENIPATKYSYEQEITLAKNMFTRTGYVLSGWSLERDGEMVYADGAKVKQLNPDKDGAVTLYAVWTPIEYTVSFNANGGTGSMTELNMVYDVEKTLPANTFTKEGYHFIGWAVAENGTVVFTDEKSIKNVTYVAGKNVELFAVWEINVYTVTFKYYNIEGTYVTENVNVKHGKTAKVPESFSTESYKSKNAHRVFSSWDSSLENITGAKTITAQYGADAAHSFSSVTTESTCTVLGSTVYTCDACKYSYTVNAEALKEHEWDEGKVAAEPGCLTAGSFVKTCKNCGGKTSSAISPTGHSFVAFPAKEPSCSEEGNIAHKHCENCSKCFATDALETAPNSEALSDEQVKIAKIPHTAPDGADCSAPCNCTVCGEAFNLAHTYVGVVTKPDCTNGGYTTYTCSVCDDDYVGDYVDANGHSEGVWRVTTAPDCTNKGVETNKCSVCFTDWTTREVAAEGHDSGAWKTTVAPKCEEWGTESLLCTKCDTSLNTRGIAPKGHGETKTEVTLEAGCETAGKKSTICLDCNKELSFIVIPQTGHTAGAAATCETDCICTVCKEVLVDRLGHIWNDGVITKEPSETETGLKVYTCQRDNSHIIEETLAIRIVITIPEIPADGTVDFDADENSCAGNINDLITVEAGLSYSVTSSDNNVVTIEEDGTIRAFKDGEAVITVKTSDGKFSKSFTVTVRTLKTVTFDVRGVLTTVKSYAGETVTAPTVDSYSEGGFTYRFKNWTVNGVATDSFIVTGDMTFVAAYTSSCNYTELDKLSEIFFRIIGGEYDNEDQLVLYKNDIEEAKALIEEFSKDRDTRDIDEQKRIDAAAEKISGLLSRLYPEESARIYIIGDETVALGSVTTFKAYLSPLNTIVLDGIWVSSDESIGFFINGKFHAVRTGTVTVTVASGNISASMEVTVVAGATNARVIMFDSLLSNANYIVEGSLVIQETTNIFWPTDAPICFRVITDGTFEEYIVYINNKVVTPDDSGTYTIPANTGDAHVKIEGVIKDEDGNKRSIWDAIAEFFRKVAEFFRGLFGG